MKKQLILAALFGAVILSAASPSEVDRAMWYREAKFGMFIHWGPYSLASVEAFWPIMRPAKTGGITKAAKKEGMPLGFYYSPPDMNHPGFRDTSKLSATNWNGEPARPEWPHYLNYLELQFTELLARYGDAALIWLDGGKSLRFTQQASRLEIDVEDSAPDSVATVLALKLK